MGDQAYKDKHKELGLCVDCSEPAYPNKTRCARHLINRVESSRRYYKKHKEYYQKLYKEIKEKRLREERCYACGGPLDDPERWVTCVNCREKIYQPRDRYAKSPASR